MSSLTSRRATVRRSLASVAVVAALGLVTACGSSSSDSDADASSGSIVPAADQGKLKSEVPAEFADGISVASQADIAPLTYTNDSGKTVGFDQDMIKAVASVLGIKIDASPVTFENVILGLDSGKYDFVVDPTITAERLLKYDMVSYFTSSNSVITQDSTDALPDEDTALCGMKIGTVTGEVSGPYVTDTIDPACADAGEDKVATTEYKDFASAVLALKGGNVEGIFVDTMTFTELAKTAAGDGLEQNGPSRRIQSNSSFAFLKGGESVALAPVVQKAVNTLIDNGVYADLLAKYDLTSNGLTGPSELNPATDK